MQRTLLIASTIALAACLKVAASILPPQPPPGRREVEREGRHLVQIAGGCGCHGPNFAGWRRGGPDTFPRAAPFGERFVSPDGIVPAPNITPDAGTGIGGWTDQEIEQALTEGIEPGGGKLSPIMPYRAYAGMSRADIQAIVAYLHCLRPVDNDVPAPVLNKPVEDLPPALAADVRPAGGVDLGRYLVRNVCSCADCHGDNLAGKVMRMGSELTVVPNITPGARGVGQWSEGDIARYLRTGSRPDGGLAQGPMAAVILTSFSHLSPAEARAVAEYLKTVPPVDKSR